MNNLLKVKLTFKSEPNRSGGGARNLNKTRSTKSSDVSNLINDLIRIESFFKNNPFIDKILVDTYYNDIISKSGRMRSILTNTGDCSDYIVGARFSNDQPGKEKHIITYYITSEDIHSAIKKLKDAKSLIDDQLNGEATALNFQSSDKNIVYSKYGTPRLKLRDVVIDCSAIEKFGVPNAVSEINKEQIIVTFFQTELNLDNLLHDLGISREKYYFYYVGKNTLSVNKDVYNILLEKVPYLISMATSDISNITPDEISKSSNNHPDIPSPKNEPIIGVIDTMFDKKAYFHEWVDYREDLDEVERYTLKEEHYNHGTAVSSIIVDGPSLNPKLDDGCGRFKVRHFGVCPGAISPSRLVKKIEKIINENTDIHVWNLSLGTNDEVSRNFISFDAAALDDIQKNKNVIFVIAGTNDGERHNQNDPYKRVGSPADSLNSLVVNSVRQNGKPASYSREGKILSFFNKPDVSYYGGDYDERINVYTNHGMESQYGTSFAAPWIARKLCYLIDVMGFSREVAKALIIDSAAGWEYAKSTEKLRNIIGYGVVPIRIEEIIEADNSEIRFVVQGISNAYTTSNYAIPVPKNNDKTNYIARATLCYFPECNRLQGVDYTQRELSIRFGRITDKRIKDINENTQDDDDSYNSERKARNEFRKWENTKFISNLMKDNARSLKVYNDGLWGLSLTSKERRTKAKKDDLVFGIVITLKNIKGENKINDFKHACLLRGYIVNEIKIDNQIEIYEKAQEDIKFD